MMSRCFRLILLSGVLVALPSVRCTEKTGEDNAVHFERILRERGSLSSSNRESENLKPHDNEKPTDTATDSHSEEVIPARAGSIYPATLHSKDFPSCSSSTFLEEEMAPPEIWDDGCPFYALQGGLEICGDFKMTGRLIVVSGMDVQNLFEVTEQTPELDDDYYLKVRCTRGAAAADLVSSQPEEEYRRNRMEAARTPLHIPSSLLIPRGDVFVAGPVKIGGSLLAKEISINTGGLISVGLTSLQHYTGKNDNSTVECPVLGPRGEVLAPFSEADEYMGLSVEKALLSATSSTNTSLHHSVGDVTSMGGQILVDNAGLLLAFGNVQANSLILDDGAYLHSVCGQIFTNTTAGAGIAVLDGAELISGGLLESQTVALTLQDAASVRFHGGLVVTQSMQVDEASKVYVGASLISSLVAIDDQSQVDIGGAAEVLSLLETIDHGHIHVEGNLTVGILQAFDGGRVEVGKEEALFPSNLYVENFAVLDGGASIEIRGGRTYIGDSLHVANTSSFALIGGDIFVNSTTRIISSFLNVQGGHFFSTSPLLVGRGSRVGISGNVVTAGTTSTDINELNKNSTYPAPALYMESAEMIIGGILLATNSWIELSRGSTVRVLGQPVDSSTQEIEPSASFSVIVEKGMILLKSGSVLNVTQSGISADVGISLERSARVAAPKGHVTADYVDLDDRSVFIARTAEFFAEAFISGRSIMKMVGKNALLQFGGSLLTVDEWSSLVSPGVQCTGGDIFVEDGGQLSTTVWDITARGFVVAQDRAFISSARNIVALENDIVVENSAHLKAVSLLAPSGVVRITPESVLDISNPRQEIIEYLQEPPLGFLQQLQKIYYQNREDGTMMNATTTTSDSLLALWSGGVGVGGTPTVAKPNAPDPLAGSWDRWRQSPSIVTTEDSVLNEENESSPDDEEVNKELEQFQLEENRSNRIFSSVPIPPSPSSLLSSPPTQKLSPKPTTDFPTKNLIRGETARSSSSLLTSASAPSGKFSDRSGKPLRVSWGGRRSRRTFA